MKSDTLVDYAVFQLSPKRSRCELFISSNGNTEKLASGLVQPFVTHLKVAEEQFAQAVQSIKLEVERQTNTNTWFTKGTLERFVRFVSTPEILEMVNSFDTELSQLEAARKIYSLGDGDQISGALGGDGTGAMIGADATKKELLRAMEVRLATVRQDLTNACACASAAGFNPDTVSELQLFSDYFSANSLNEACTRFISLCQRRPDLISLWKPGVEDQVVRSLWGSDMSIDDPAKESLGSHFRSQQLLSKDKHQYPQASQEQQQQNSGQNQHYLHLTKSSVSGHSSSSFSGFQHGNQNENKEAEKEEEEGAVELLSTNQLSQPARRLSVQDRINLFENKQKENSGSKPVVVGRSAELRRLSSDVSSAPEKSVLRRWSGASDTSIDLGNDKKDTDNIDSPLCTPSSSSVSQSKSNVFGSSSDDNKDQKADRSMTSLAKTEAKNISGINGQDELQAYTSDFGARDQEVGLKGKSTWKDQAKPQSLLKSSAGKGESAADQLAREEKFKVTLGGEERNFGLKDLVSSEEKSRDLQDTVKSIGRKNQTSLQSQFGNSVGGVGDVQLGKGVEDVEARDQLLNKLKFRDSQTHTQSLSGQREGAFGINFKDMPPKEIEGDQSASPLEWRLPTGEVEQDGKKDFVFSGKEASIVDDLQVPKMKVQNSLSTNPEQKRKMQKRREETGSVLGSKAALPSKKSSESQQNFATSQAPLMEQSQRVRQSKGNQELNDELKMKANELEKLFAEHKLRVPEDQSSSTRKRATIMQYRKSATVAISSARVQDKKTVIGPIGSTNDILEFNASPKKMVDHQGFHNSAKKNIYELSFSDDSRGKFYEKYMQKRDAKLREEWGMKRVEKEAKLKAMQDSLEQSRAEMKARLPASADKKDSVNSTDICSDHFRKSNIRSSMKKVQQPVDSTQSEEDEELSELSEKKYYRQDRSFSDVSFVDVSPKSSQNKKILPNRNSSSSTPRTTAVPLPRSSAKVSNSNSARRRGQSENPLAQSVPNFSDLRKENTKPSSGVGKTANRSQTRNYSRIKSTNEEVPHAKEEKHRRSHSLRKSTASEVELKDVSPLNSDSVALSPLQFDEEQIEQGFYEKPSKNVELKPFLKKGDGMDAGVGASVAKQKASVISETLTNGEEFESHIEVDDSIDVATREEKEEFETTEVEGSAIMNNGKVRSSEILLTTEVEDRMGLSGSENGDPLRSLSHMDPSSVSELPSSVPSTYHAVGSLQDSPGESPVSWNSRMHHPFSYPHETSDIDAFVDSPIGSPASWNSHSLSQTEADAARMRKKWGSAQKPIFVANSSHNPSRKDVTKGFKRLLKFGRSRRGTDNLVDWISATTSEGDDDTEDGRDPASRSLEDLRKSRMGFSRGHPSDDSFNESELFNEHVQALRSSIPAPAANFKLRDDHVSGSSIKAPKSFFSLSSFRSKGSEARPR